MATLIELLKKKKDHWRIDLVNEHRTVDFGASARIKDPLFAVGRQWQLDRFRAFNGGSLVKARVASIKQKLAAKASLLEDSKPIEFQLNQTEEENPEKQAAHFSEKWNHQRLQYNGEVVSQNEELRLSFYNLKGEDFDWYNFQISKVDSKMDRAEKSDDLALRKFTFKGQPEQRWWAFEDSRVDLNSIIRPYVNPVTMLLMSNLQGQKSYFTYLVALPVTPGDFVKVKSVVLIDSFGIERKYKQASPVFSHTTTDKSTEAHLGDFYYPDSMINRALSSGILEEVQFNTDHFSNVIWAIEKRFSNDQGFVENIDEKTESEAQLLNRLAKEREAPSTEKTQEDLKNVAFYAAGDGEDAAMIHFPSGSKPPEGLSGPFYLDRLQVLSRIPRNAFPLIKQKAKDSGDLELRLGKVSKQSEYQTNLLKQLEIIDSSYLPEHPSRLVRRYYLAFDSNKIPYLWVGTQHRLSERAFPIPVLFDQLV